MHLQHFWLNLTFFCVLLYTCTYYACCTWSHRVHLNAFFINDATPWNIWKLILVPPNFLQEELSYSTWLAYISQPPGLIFTHVGYFNNDIISFKLMMAIPQLGLDWSNQVSISVQHASYSYYHTSLLPYHHTTPKK